MERLCKLVSYLKDNELHQFDFQHVDVVWDFVQIYRADAASLSGNVANNG
jgi:hypothetical protein